MSVQHDAAPPESVAVGPWSAFRKSSFCGAANCVEVAADPGGNILVRDSKEAPGHGPVLRFSAQEWTDFLRGATTGEFDPDALMAHS